MEIANALKQSEAVRISSLESEVRRLRSAHVLATSLATGSLIATMAIIVSYAVSAIGDPSNAAFDQVTCRGLIVTDSTGRSGSSRPASLPGKVRSPGSTPGARHGSSQGPIPMARRVSGTLMRQGKSGSSPARTATDGSACP